MDPAAPATAAITEEDDWPAHDLAQFVQAATQDLALFIEPPETAGDAGKGRTPAITADQHAARQATLRRAKAMDALAVAIDNMPSIPPPVTEIVHTGPGIAPMLTAEAIEKARVTYYMGFGSLTDCAKVLVASGLVSDTNDVTQVRDRLRGWWKARRWPKRSSSDIFAIRDANHDGGLYRSSRICVDVATGSGPAPKGKACPQSALEDSDYCFHHDPRPEYVEARRRQTENLRAGRQQTMVPLEPLQAWCDSKRKELLEKAKKDGSVHPNNQGWGLLAEAMSIDPTQLTRIMAGKHSSPTRPPVTTIKAETVERYLAEIDTTFRDIYGFDPPKREDTATTCPGCGGVKNHGSVTCRKCYDDSLGSPCSYVNRSGCPCPARTRHESGYCPKCRRIVFRKPKPRVGRPSAISDQMLLFALDAFRETGSIAWAARLMWATNAGEVREAYKSRISLDSGLVKRFKKLALTETDGGTEAAYTSLKAALGVPCWPLLDRRLEGDGEVPVRPFQSWLRDRYEEVSSYRELSEILALNADKLSQLIRGGSKKRMIQRRVVDRVLDRFEGDTTYEDLYTLECSG